MKALVFGGAFNPPTIAHLEMAEKARLFCGYDKVVFVPSKSHYIQVDQGKELMFSEEERFSLLKKVASSRSWMDVSDYELKQKDQPRTYFTLKALSEQYGEVKLLFGSDKLPELETGWRYVDEIGKEFGFVCMVRNHDDIDSLFKMNPYLAKRRSYFTFVPAVEKYQDISSTVIREKIEKKESLKGFVPDEILADIEKKEKSAL